MAEETKPSLLTRKDWRVLAIAIGLGMVAVVLMNLYIGSKKKEETLVSVAAAAIDMSPGTTIKRNMLQERLVPQAIVTTHVVHASEMSSLDGRSVSVGVDRGQPINWQFVTVSLDSSIGERLDYKNKERAFSLSLNNPLTDAVNPGDVIDIYGTFAEAGGMKGMQLLPGVTVIDRVGKFIVLSVTPQEALFLSVASQISTLTFTVRSKQETGRDTTLEPVTAAEIRGVSKTLSEDRIRRGPKIYRVGQ
jgi:Flp pilus assembly protein CpaB